MADAEHEHHFKPIIKRTAPIGGWEYIAGHEPCECGLTYARWAVDPLVNMKAAVARYLAASSKPWSGYSRPR